MKHLSIRKIILGIVTAGSSYIAGGAVLDTVSNAIAQITLPVTIVGTFVLALSWTAIQVVLKTHPIHWQNYKVKRLGYYPSCVFVGIGLLLWTPPILNQFTRSSPPAVSSQVKSAEKEAKVVILLSEFSGIDPQAYGVTQIIFDQLNEVTKGYGDVKLKLLREVIETSDVAAKKGKEAQADIVLWGNYLVNQSQARVTIHFDILNKSLDIPVHGDKEIMTAKTVKLENFTIQEMLSKKMSYLILLTIGIVRIEALDFDGAMASFTQALSLSATPCNPPLFRSIRN